MSTINKILKNIMLLLIISMLSNNLCCANSLIKFKKNSNDENAIEIPEKKFSNNEEINILESSELLSQLVEEQKDRDIKDIELLWEATVENNPMIEFVLKKLATPESQRRIHSSLMSKTVSALVSGASFVPTLLGTNPTIQTSAFSAGRIAQNLINKKNIPQEVPLTDTELIELASMIEELQDNLINAYYNYKNTLMQLKATRKRLMLYSKNYSQALNQNDAIEKTISFSLYNSMLLEELTLEQEAKKYHVLLQRLAGKKAIKSLELNQYDFDSMLYRDNSLKNEDVKEEI